MRLCHNHLQPIIDLGRQGIHLLFGPEQIKQAFGEEESGSTPPTADHKAQLLRGLRLVTTLPTTGEQVEFLATLPDAVQHNVCRFYFQLISEESGEAPLLN